eukprot:TRINITY_DN3572_c0_g1_i1.p2 TRINITY_DN3572_c0_g1~~TRINITY_DN3572_c0_g1_i1.p2  ORF type:complete len:463 (+),score=150.12 TRINITY_DN3572_c0_g1_i1:90-1391(+)
MLTVFAGLAAGQGIGVGGRGDPGRAPPTPPTGGVSAGFDPSKITDPGLITDTGLTGDSDLLANFAGERTVSGSTYEPGCKPAWAKGQYNQCFSEIPSTYPANEWGWTNVVFGTGATLDFWNSAGCDTSSAEHVGTLDVVVDDQRVTLTANIKAGYELKDVRFYVGSTKLPIRQGWYKASPFYYAWQYLSKGPHACVKPDGYVWVAAYVEVCKCADVGTGTTLVKVIDADGSDWDSGANALSSEKVSEGMLSWTVDGNTPTLHNFPPVLTLPNVLAHFPHQEDGIVEGKKIRVKCPENCDNLPCEVIIITYHCPPCSSSTNGNFPSTLPMAGWTPAHCSPRFRYFTTKHEMVGFRKLVPAGETEDTPVLERRLSNVAVFVRQGAVDCAGIDQSSACAGSSECFWDRDECKSRWCPPNPPGDRPKCDDCAITRVI